MLDNCVITFNKVTPNSTLAHNKIANFFAENFSFKIIDNKEELLKPKKYNFGILVNGLEVFCEYRKELLNFIVNNVEKKVYIQNDYNILPKKETLNNFENGYLLSTLKTSNLKVFANIHYVDFNSLSLNYNYDISSKREREIIYYGAFRKGRKTSFDKYFNSDKYTLYLSTSTKALKKFEEAYKCPVYIPPLKCNNNFLPELLNYRYTFYLEDNKNHNNNFSFPNRFYECLSAGVVMLVDTNCLKTFIDNNINVEPFIVKDSENAIDKINTINKNYSFFQKMQHDWVDANTAHENLISKIEKILNIKKNVSKKGLSSFL